jgi:hypothetical protein
MYKTFNLYYYYILYMIYCQCENKAISLHYSYRETMTSFIRGMKES